MEKISYAKTVYGNKEINAVIKCLSESTQMGNYARKFEERIANIFAKNHCLYVNSGSSALFLGIEAFDFPKGSEIITPALTFATTVGSIVKNNLVPVFTDVEKLTYCIDHNQIESLITDKTVAIMAPNLLGNLCEWDRINQIAKTFNLKVIEDSADTLGATINTKPTGSFTDMSITSFYGSHIINCAGNGGALTLNDQDVYEKAKLLRSWGRSSSLFNENSSEDINNRFNVNLDGIEYDSKFVFEKLGYNLEGSEIGAAFGLAQLEDLNENIKTRQKNLKKQNQFFLKHSDFFEIPIEKKNVNTGWLAYPLLIKENAPFTRREFQIFLEERDIQTRVVFTGNIMKQPMMRDVNYKTMPSEKNYINSNTIMKQGVLLPLHHGMNENMFNRLHSTIEEFLENKK